MAQQRATNITWHQHTISKQERWQLAGHQGMVLWFTGLPSSGKSTVANLLDQKLYQRRVRSFVLDGDNIRHGLNKNLGFSAEDRAENIRRIGEVAKLFVDAGVIAITAFVSPYRADRNAARALVQSGEFVEIFVDCPVEECERRDPKGLYQKARRGELKGFTGVDDPYEPPQEPELVLASRAKPAEVLAEEVIGYLEGRAAFQV
ncbi:MAG: adenylyl-sulfate kinase [Planctomycetes bacterium]|nr:adenylyl-sulfate kinase [Planctomycetota bacterium]